MLSQILTSSLVAVTVNSLSKPRVLVGAAGPAGPVGPAGATGPAGGVLAKSTYRIQRNSDTDYVLPACVSGIDLRDAEQLNGVVIPAGCSAVVLSARFKLVGYTAAGSRNWGFTRTRGDTTEALNVASSGAAQPGWINYSTVEVVEAGDLLRFVGVLATALSEDSELKVILLG